MDVPLRRCIGSTRFGIEAHDAPATDFPAQPSQKDGLGRMCRSHWTHYTGGLRKAALAKKAAQAAATEPAPEPPALDQDSSSVSLAARLLGAKSTGPYRRDDDDADLDATIEPAKPAKPARAPRAAKPAAKAKAPLPPKRTSTRTPRAPRKPAAEVAAATALVDATERLGGTADTEAMGSDAVQVALELLASANREIPMDETIDAGTEEADLAIAG